jgi:hypothetical protein
MSNGTIDVLTFKQNIADISKAIPTLLSKDSNEMISGLNKVIDEATTIAGMSFDTAKLNPITKVGIPLGAGLAAGSAITGSVTGGVSGVALAYGITKFVNSKIGQKLLIKAASPGGKTVAQSIVNGILLQGILKYGDNYMNPQQESTPDNSLPEGPVDTIGVRN